MMMKKNEKLELRDVAVDAAESTELVEVPEKKQPKKIWLLLAALGPGIVTAMAGNDAGGISTYSTVGAKFGFATLWVIPIMCVLLIVVEMTAARMGAVTGKGFAALIRERFGIRLTALAMLALLIGNVATTFSEFAGIASGMEMFGVSKYLAVPVAAVAVWLLVVGGSYKRVEKVFLILSLVFVTYIVAAFMAEPNWEEALTSTVVPRSATSPRSSDHTCRRITGSRPSTGSSRMRYSGIQHMVSQKAACFCIPLLMRRSIWRSFRGNTCFIFSYRSQEKEGYAPAYSFAISAMDACGK